ncbi:hypothetical protein RSOLAG22IIIB_04125 [Rhizoctonia solani]|uniref:Uncharacterized protein n=1 Tax=Rhizoctonia solani TaxID=456999 RepID=A0A0K6FUW4_9AGAM|nr:hypothetical protein RSOLAG22IIIB_04125 [Rhizoctonia solani]
MPLPSTFTKEPDADATLADLRLRQWRRPSRNPFEPTNSEPDIIDAEDLADNVPHLKRRPAVRSRSTRSGRSGVKRSGTSHTFKSKHSEPDSEHPELKHPGSKWVHLFYDLAWTASFASLTQNGKFQNPLDTLNYFLFFAAVMWLWASQTLYSIHFYTNDWFHLMSTFLQLFVFGMLSATTLGYDVTTYIVHSPGTNTLRNSEDKDDNDPQRFIDEKTARLSMLVLAIAFASTRFIHLVQYLRVLYYARWSTRINQVKDKSNTNRSGTDPQVPTRPWIECIPPQLKFITSGLLISNPMFIAALVISALPFGQTITGASLKLGLWFGGFLVELLSHLSIPVYRWVTKRIRLLNGAAGSGSGSEHGGNSSVSISSGYELPVSPGMDLCERLQTVTTIILGEGINGIAGTLSAVMVAPGAGRAVVVNVISAACTIWFIAYIYFEGPKGDKAPQTKSLRYILWLILHLPFLASTVLLLIGIKNQFLLTVRFGS